MRPFINFLLVTLFCGSLTVFMYCNDPGNDAKGAILQSTIDPRGLTSVIYTNGEGDTLALDYLTGRELDSLINVLK